MTNPGRQGKTGIPAHNGPTIDAEAPSAARQAINDAVPLRSVAAATPRAHGLSDPTPYEADLTEEPVDRSAAGR